MANIGVTQAQTDRACAALAAAGENVTVDAVRAYLGTGSKSTLAPFVKEWKRAHPQGLAPAGDTGLPGELLEAVQQVHRLLQAEAQVKVDAALASEAAATAAAATALGAAAEREAALAAENARLAAQLTDALKRGTALEETVAAQELALTRLETEGAGLAQRLADRAAELHAARAQHAQLQKQYAHLEQRAAETLQAERASAAQRTEQLLHERAQLQQRVSALEAEARERTEQLRQVREIADRVSAALEAAQEGLAKLRAEREQLAGTLGQAVAARDASVLREQDLAQQLSEMRLELAGKTGEAKILQRDLTRVQQLYDKLQEEKGIWRQERAAMEDLLRERGDGQ